MIRNTMEKAPEGTPGSGGLLVVIVPEAQGKHHTNPYVNILFKGEERKTKSIKKNRNTKWKEEFQFMLDEPPINEKLHVEVISTSSRIGLLHSKELLGYVDIDLSDVDSNKRINEWYHPLGSKKRKDTNRDAMENFFLTQVFSFSWSLIPSVDVE